MRLQIGIPTLLLLLAVGSPAIAQNKQGNVPSGSIASRLRAVQFEIVAGRLTATSLNLGANWNNNVSDGVRRERLTLDLTNADPNLRYELVDKNMEISLEVTDGEKFLIRHVRKEDQGTRSMEFAQSPQKDLTLSLETPEGKRVASGPTLWHLLLAEPELTKQLLAPILEILKPGLRLATVTDAIEDGLCQNARLQRTVDRKHWIAWVDDLASPNYADRQAAERELLDTGRDALPFLRGFERAKLDAEQWRRIRNIIAALDNQQGDSVEQTVALLAGDARAWLSLVNRDDESKRRLAMEQLASITGQPIDFDPAAEASVRRKQYEALLERFTPPAQQP